MNQSSSTEAKALFQRYLVAFDEYGSRCRTAPERWHRPDVAEFSALRGLLLPQAEANDADCQYALATIAWLGLCCETEEEHRMGHLQALEEATFWWIAAGKQGSFWAVDNLLCMGKGPEAERARAVAEEVKRDCARLVGHDAPSGMPIYGPAFMQEVTRRLYGVVRTGNE